MTKYCESCGEPNDDEAVHCNQCGTKFKGTSKENEESSNIQITNNQANFIEKLPLILAIISILIGIIEGLTAPMLIGAYEIYGSLLIVIIGGIIGLYLMRKKEYFVAGLEFIVIALVLFLCLGRLGLFGTVLFIITGILLFYLKGTKFSSKKLFAIPILTIIVVLIILIVGGGLSFVSSQNAISVSNIAQSSTYSYGFYEVNVDGDIKVDAPFDYLEVHMDFYDGSGNIVYSTIAWNELNVKGGETYHFSGKYFKEIQPTKVKITVIDSAKSTSPLYNQTIDITA